MRYRDNIEWLKSLKQQIGQTQHRDLWHFEQVIDETIENLKPLAKPHGRLIDADELLKNHAIIADKELIHLLHRGTLRKMIDKAPTIIEAENSSAIDDDVKKYCDYLKSETYDFCNRIENGEVNEG